MRAVVVPNSILLAFVSWAAVGIFFGCYPANQATQLDPIDRWDERAAAGWSRDARFCVSTRGREGPAHWPWR
jgi:hypothetical protein